MLIDVKTTLLMWEKTDMPDSNYDEATKKWIKTGGKTEKTTYTFRDIDGSKLVFLSGNKYREYEGRSVNLQIDLSYDNFTRANKLKLESVTLAD